MRFSRLISGILAVMAAAAPALAQGAVPAPRSITVSGEGEAKAAPDQAQLQAGVVTTARKAGDALAANTKAMNQVFAALKRLGIPDKAIQTADFSVNPQNAPDRNGNASQQITGYQVSNQVVVTVEMAKLGAALDALVASGANNLGGMTFSIHDPKPLLAQARAAAMKDAGQRAETYAAAGGFKLGPILAVTESGSETPPPFAPRPMMRMAAAVPVASGENTIGATVTVTYEIR
ncbi:MAG TPA: SIMPL domain-containing protein [Rhizomicrobium sp.]|jgi:hypothetical protein|nr:SIMPL domain-containing protein [Rhizomicrobium sp.]